MLCCGYHTRYIFGKPGAKNKMYANIGEWKLGHWPPTATARDLRVLVGPKLGPKLM